MWMRILATAPLGVAMTLVLLYIMQRLIDTGIGVYTEPLEAPVMLAVAKSEETRTDAREMPPRKDSKAMPRCNSTSTRTVA